MLLNVAAVSSFPLLHGFLVCEHATFTYKNKEHVFLFFAIMIFYIIYSLWP